MIVSCTGADGEDGACVFPEHGREHGADQGVAGAEVECEHAVEGGGGLLPERVSSGVAADGADQAIDAVVVGNELGDESVDGGFVGDVDSVAGECRAGTGGFPRQMDFFGSRKRAPPPIASTETASMTIALLRSMNPNRVLWAFSKARCI